jgi:hypothetical protein
MYCRNTVEYHSACKKEFLPYATTWINLRDIMLIEINHRKKYYIIPFM